MKKLSFWKADWFLGLLVTVVMLIAARGNLIQSLERKAYDLGVKAASRTPSDRIAIIAIDDAGIARVTDSSRTKTGVVLGTPSYMSPEQLAGKKVEGRLDLFSLGFTLYQMLSGSLPFTGDSMVQLMFKIANEPHSDIRTVNPALPTCVAAVISKSLAKDPDYRYQTGEQMAKAIRLYLGTMNAPAKPAAAVS